MPSHGNSIEELIEHSSFGAPPVKDLRRRTSDDIVGRIVDRVKQLGRKRQRSSDSEGHDAAG